MFRMPPLFQKKMQQHKGRCYFYQDDVAGPTGGKLFLFLLSKPEQALSAFYNDLLQASNTKIIDVPLFEMSRKLTAFINT